MDRTRLLNLVRKSKIFAHLHGLVDPLCGTSWHKWNRYKLHRGIELVPWHKERPPSWVYDLCRGLFWPLLVPMGQVWYNQPACPTGTNATCSNILVPLGQVVLVPLGQAQPVPICLSHWDRLCLSQWLVPVGQVWYRHHPSKVGPWPCQPKTWAKRYQLMVSACQTCIPKGCMMTPTTRDMNRAWDLRTVCSTFKQILFSVLPWCHKVDELNSRQNKPM